MICVIAFLSLIIAFALRVMKCCMHLSLIIR
jgi:hypothetical protein